MTIHSDTPISFPSSLPVQSPPLLERLRQAACARGDSEPTVAVLVAWARVYILFHDKKHPATLGLPQVVHFLEHVARTEANPLPALAMARSALMLLYSTVLTKDLGELPHPRPPRLLDQLRQVLRVRHYSPRTEECYVNWVKRFIYYHHKRHPRTMGATEVEQFLTHLAVVGHISASSQNQARSSALPGSG